MEVRNYGKVTEVLGIPNLVELQTESYKHFLQLGVPPDRRNSQGLEEIIREIFPVSSFDGSMTLEYLSYELGRPRYSQDECRKLRLTYGYPFKIRVRLDKGDIVEEDVYLGEVPIMIGGGEFLINGAERVIVSQLHRSPGVDFEEELIVGDRRQHSCWIIPERGSWIEINVTKKDTLAVRIDQSGKFPAMTLLRAMDPSFSTNADIIRLFHTVKTVQLRTKKAIEKLVGQYVADDLPEPDSSGDPEDPDARWLIRAGEMITEAHVELFSDAKVPELNVIQAEGENVDPIVLNSLAEDPTATHEKALLKIYVRLRPGNPANIDKARQLFHEKFRDPARYRLGRVGRFRLNRKFGQGVPELEMTLLPEDYTNALRYLLLLRAGKGEVDDIDHLGNRRVRTIAELAGDEIRKGFLKLRRTIQERMSLDTKENITPRSIINSKTISSAVDYFFGRSELSQVVDQTNPLSQLTHERRLSALGPGGLNRKRAGFEVRDVHISHYGRICPIETPEGTNIGLIASLSIYSSVDEYGFLTTPYRKVSKGVVAKSSEEVEYLRADQEAVAVIAPADTVMTKAGRIEHDMVLARNAGEFQMVTPKQIQYVDVSPKQIIGISASLIPFLEHDDANRALMGSNMQRQAVPLLTTEPPVVATGMERVVAQNSGMVVRAESSGTVTAVDSLHIVIDDDDVYELRKFRGLNERTCLNQRPLVNLGDHVEASQIIADGAATSDGELALGKNVLVAFVPWDGYNFEDAVLVSERLVREDVYTSIHIDVFEVEIRETKLGREEFTRDIPNVSERALKNLGEDGIVRVGTKVRQGDVLVGKVAPKSKSELSPEEKLLLAIFGKGGEDVKNDSLDVPSGVEGIVIDTQKFSRKVNLTKEEREEHKRIETEARDAQLHSFKKNLKEMVAAVQEVLGSGIEEKGTGDKVEYSSPADITECNRMRERMHPTNIRIPRKRKEVEKAIAHYYRRIDEAEDEMNRAINRLSRGDELPTGVLELVKVYVATKRVLSVGDKVAGRHGNKGVISRILPVEDMPFLEDGTTVDMCLNPLGVPSRMNVGQILETHLGLAARSSNFQAVTPAFNGAHEDDIERALEEAGFDSSGTMILHDGRTGEPFDQRVTVGYLYMLKLHHLVDDKVHARATGPYSLITQQPLGGKARFGGQRFGEMEVWALEAYGAANVLQELLTVKSDDVEGRTKIYEAMVKGENILEAGVPVSFDVLTNEIRGLALNLELVRRGDSQDLEAMTSEPRAVGTK